ncbi:MAG TPA: type II toxin-antitoxin system HicA family toxin [Magnetococcales bacterium]|nr:type II toxin-antitoxin system HicA family toxin [Magnetococcales bacterium]
MSSREVIKALKNAGWLLDSIRGDHHHFKHPTLPGKVTVRHPVKDLSLMEIKSIEKQAIQKIR